MLAQSTSVLTDGARRTKRSRFPTTKAIKMSPANEEDCRWNQVWAEMIYPPAGDRRNRKHDRDDQDAFAICDRNHASKQDQRKQAGYDEFATFNFLRRKAPR